MMKIVFHLNPRITDERHKIRVRSSGMIFMKMWRLLQKLLRENGQADMMLCLRFVIIKAVE